MSEPVLQLEDVTKSFPAYRSLGSLLTMKKPPRTGVLDGLHLSCGSGTITGIVGPNGAGKTTLLRLVAGSLIPDSGRIRVAGTDPVSNPGDTAMVTGFMGSSERSFYWRLSVMENLRFFGRLQGLHGTELEERIEKVLSMTGSEQARSKRFAVLSDGFRRRLSLARALLHDPTVMILDEPTKSLDPETADSFRELISALAGEGRTILLATHSRDDATVCGTVLRLADGRLKTMETGP